MTQYLLQKSVNGGAGYSGNQDGSPTCALSAATSDSSTQVHGKDAWIAYQRDSLARIFHVLAQVRESMVKGLDSCGTCSKQSTLSSPQSFSLKTHRESEQKADGKSSGQLWREDIPGEMERLQPLMSARAIKEIAGGALLPTLTVCGNWNRKGASQNSGDGLATALRKMPTLTKSDGMGGPGRSQRRQGGLNLRTALKELLSLEGFPILTQKRLRSQERIRTPSDGHRLTPAFAEWWMGWPIGWTGLKPAETGKSHCKRQ